MPCPSRLSAAASLLVLACTTAVAQPASPSTPQGTSTVPPPLERQQAARPAGQRPDQRVERIVVEDGGSRVDELRYAGQTQSITVQPKTGAPEYQVQPDGVRVWNVLKF